MKKEFLNTYRYLLTSALVLAMTVSLSSCNDDTDILPENQKKLIGHAVNFDVTKADVFTTRTTWDPSGLFNEDDIMRIFRQYSQNGVWESGKETYRTYYYKTIYASDVIRLNSTWQVKEGRNGYNSKADAFHPVGEFVQTDKDSLTWENGNTLRFRAWSRSNYSGCINDKKANFYPDFSIADYVNSSGPSNGIPLVLRHMGCRIVFAERDNGNEITRVEICGDINPDGTPNPDGWKDYMRRDNSSDLDSDKSETEQGKSEAQAKIECDSVSKVYKRMCMPAGVDMTNQALYAMPVSLWDSPTLNLSLLENYESEFVEFGTKTPAQISSSVMRPKFSEVNGSFYLISTPYDMSNAGTKGDMIVLPACTRFRVYMKDVNNGDQYGTSGYEGAYHIFTLGDIKDSDGKNAKFPDGLILRPGYSYKFSVGYRYGELSVTAEDNFSWTQQEKKEMEMSDQTGTHDVLHPNEYTWWKNAIKNAIPKGTEDFNPVFEISSRKEFMEFISLVNGTATDKTAESPLRCKIIYHKIDDDRSTKEYKWYDINEDIEGRDTTFHEQSYFESQGYIFYEHYHAANADRAAYSETDYLRGNYAFYDDDLRSHFKVKITADIDFLDLSMSQVGAEASTPFMGYLDGQGYKFKNVNMGTGVYIFNHTDGAAISNLRVESTHNVSLLNEGINGTYVLGVSMLTNTTGNVIANTLRGTSFVVGCIHQGDGTKALVGKADNLYMYGCMQTSEQIAGGALLGAYIDSDKAFFAPQTSSKISWGRFMCNYYDKQLSPSANAVGDITDAYHRLEYIRGCKTYVLKAKNDVMLGIDVAWNKLDDVQQKASYGLAPWKAMNYAIYKYNEMYGSTHKCTMHYESNTIGYDHRYPLLVPGQCEDNTPAAIPDYEEINPTEQNN